MTGAMFGAVRRRTSTGTGIRIEKQKQKRWPQTIAASNWIPSGRVRAEGTHSPLATTTRPQPPAGRSEAGALLRFQTVSEHKQQATKAPSPRLAPKHPRATDLNGRAKAVVRSAQPLFVAMFARWISISRKEAVALAAVGTWTECGRTLVRVCAEPSCLLSHVHRVQHRMDEPNRNPADHQQRMRQ